MPRMPAAPDSFASQVHSLRREHYSVLVDWASRRIVEGLTINIYPLLADVEHTIDWSAVVVDAAIANLGRRGWTRTRDRLVRMVAESLADTASRKTDGPKGMPLLLRSGLSHLAVIDRLGSEKARLVDANLEQELQAGLVLLGEARGQALYQAAREASKLALAALRSDVSTAGERSLRIAPEPVPARTVPRGRPMKPEEHRLAGHWINSEFLQSGTTTGRFELHMVLLPTGELARTNRSLVFSSLQDSHGNWLGSLDSIAGLGRAERGRWYAEGALLTLEMDDGSAYEYRYLQQGDAMSTTNTNGGARRHWRRVSG